MHITKSGKPHVNLHELPHSTASVIALTFIDSILLIYCIKFRTMIIFIVLRYNSLNNCKSIVRNKIIRRLTTRLEIFGCKC